MPKPGGTIYAILFRLSARPLTTSGTQCCHDQVRTTVCLQREEEVPDAL